MDKKSKILLIILIVATIASVSYTFYKTVIKQDFEVVNVEPELEDDSADAEVDSESDSIDTQLDPGTDSLDLPEEDLNLQ